MIESHKGRFMFSTALGALALATTPGLVGEADFNREVLPILSDNCFKCHGPDENTREADLRLDTKEGAFADLGGGFYPIVAGQPDESEIIWRITAEDEEDLMPPADSQLSLTPEERHLIRQWIEEGAKWRSHWSFEPVERPVLPDVADESWSRNGIDRFVLSRLEHEGLAPSPEADKTTLIRRLSLDLTGLPPTPDEVDAFLSDQRPKAYEHLVDRLLASPRYGEAMALPWLDAARYADTDGYQNDGPREMWRWRDWVIEAYNRNMPFDQFTIEQLAGDLLPDPTLDQLIATGFNRNHRYNSESGIVFEEFLLENAVDRVDTTSTVWMGLTMGCARCHDHKYDPISTKEYYQMIAFFDNVPESGRARKFGNSEPWVHSPTEGQSKRLAEKAQLVAQAEMALDNREAEIAKSLRDWELSDPIEAPEHFFLKEGLTDYVGFNGSDARPVAETGQPSLSGGLVGTAATFDGNSRYRLDGELRFASEDQFSISFWVRPEKIEQGVILSNQEDKIQRRGLAVNLDKGRVQFFIISRWVAGVGAVETVETLPEGDWTHIVVSNSGIQSASGMRIYLNGEQAETRVLYNSNSNLDQVGRDSVFRVGGGPHGPDLLGQVDELRIYDHELWEDDVALLAEPATVEEIFQAPFSDRSVSANRKLRAYFLENAAPEPLKALVADLSKSRKNHRTYLESLPTTMVMKEADSRKETHVRTRGVYHQLGERVDRKLPEALTQPGTDWQDDRLGLARWLVSGEHPLTGRVSVNRYWLKYFGRGLVESAEDFGVQGDRPSHPELLDWLADEFVRLDWDVKALQKLIVTSATYRQSSRTTPEMRERDPDNILLAHGPRERLSPHALRDQALAVSGLLVENVGGPSVSPYQPDRFWELLSNTKYNQSCGEDLYRRSLYTIWKRTIPPPSMAVLDAAGRESCIISPKRTNTPLQALALLNEKAFVEAARNFGQRVLLEGGSSVSERVKFAFRALTARYPKPEEQSLLENAYDDFVSEFSGDAEAAGQLIAVGESRPDPQLDPTALAAATTFANMLLNLDETVTKE